jgi:hypothetical protein
MLAKQCAVLITLPGLNKNNMDLPTIIDIVQQFDSQAAQAASENSGLWAWLMSALGLGEFAWHRGIAEMIDPNHALANKSPSGSSSIPQHPDYSDTRLSDLFAGNETSRTQDLSLSDVIGDSGNSSKSGEGMTLSDVLGQ